MINRKKASRQKPASRRSGRLPGWFLGVGLSLPLLCALPAGAQVPALVQEGNALVDQGLVNQAIPRLQAAVKQYPQSVEARLGLANAYFKAGTYTNTEAAFKTFNEVLQLDPMNKAALMSVGLMGEYKYEWRDDGITALTTLIGLEPNNMPARSQRALLNGYLGNLREAIVDYDVVIPTNPPPPVILAAAQSYTYAGDYTLARDLFTRYKGTGGAIESYAAIAYGIVLRETGDPAESVQVLNQVLAKTPKLDGVAIRSRAALSVSYGQLDQLDQAEAVLVPLDGRFDSRMITARSLHQINGGEDSLELEQRVIDIYYKVLEAPLPPDYVAPPDNRGRENFYLTNSIAREIADVLSGIPSERVLSRKLYVELVKNLPDDRILPVNLAIVERQLGLASRTELRTRIEPYLLPIPSGSYDRRLMTQALVRLDSPDPSLLPLYQPYVDAKVNEPLLFFRIAQMQIQANNLVAAKAALAEYQATKDGQRDVYGTLLLLAEIDRRENNLDASLQKYEQIIAAPKVDRGIRSGALQAAAGIYRLKGQLPQAIALYDQLIAQDPSDTAKPLGRASLAYQANQISQAEAESILNQWLATPSRNLPLELYSLVAALPADPQKEALYNRLLTEAPDSVPIRLRLLQVVAMRDPDGAKAQLADLIAKDPENLGSYFVQGEFAQNLGDLDLASAAYEAILARSAQNTDALAALGGVRFQQRQYGEATDLYAEVLKLQPENRIAQTAIAELAAAQGNRLEAIRKLEEIRQQNSSSPGSNPPSPQPPNTSPDTSPSTTPDTVTPPAPGANQPAPDPRLLRRQQRIEADFLQQRGFQPPWERY
jgi:cellulose synthase operon protein C